MESIGKTIQANYDDADSSPHHRNHSWEHCYEFFRRRENDKENRKILDADTATVQLAFYLASWGMYRGSSVLLQCAHTVHRGVINLIQDCEFAELWSLDFGTEYSDKSSIKKVLDLFEGIKLAYKNEFKVIPNFKLSEDSSQPTEILISKVILGTFSCMPACDRYFVSGLASHDFKYSRTDEKLIQYLLDFCLENRNELLAEQQNIEERSRIRYPVMKLVDMYFWQLGYEIEQRKQEKKIITNA